MLDTPARALSSMERNNYDVRVKRLARAITAIFKHGPRNSLGELLHAVNNKAGFSADFTGPTDHVATIANKAVENDSS